MRGTLKLLATGALVLGVTGMASAQTVYLDTLQKFINAGTGQTFIGDDPGNPSVVGAPPLTPATSGYAVIPFTVKAGASGTDAVSSVSIAGEFMASSSSTSNLGSLYGVFVRNPSSSALASLSANTGNVVGGFFQFDTTAANDGTGKGNGQFMTFTANVANGPTLTAGQTYSLVLLPKSDLTPATAADPLAHYFQLEAKTTIQLGGTQNGPLATEGIGLQEGTQINTNTPGGAQSGDVLTNNGSKYFGVRITGASTLAVPETSTLMSLGIGLVTMGGFALRRRRAA